MTTPRGQVPFVAVAERANQMLREHAEWRRGQAMFNALDEGDPDLANRIRGTTADPFYSDDRIEAFRVAVEDIGAADHSGASPSDSRPSEAETVVLRRRPEEVAKNGGDQVSVMR